MPIPNSRSRPPRILAHELRWGRGGGRQPPSVDWWLLNLTAASVPDVSCVPSPCSLDASVAGFYKLVLLYDCAASVLDAGRVPSPCSLDDSVAGFSTLELPPPCAMQRGAGLLQGYGEHERFGRTDRPSLERRCRRGRWRRPRRRRCRREPPTGGGGGRVRERRRPSGSSQLAFSPTGRPARGEAG